MAYRKRYWIDSAGRWRDRKNSNRLSTGPSRKVDRRRYRVTPPTPWRPRPKPEPQPPEPSDLLRHDSPEEYVSTFTRFLMSVDEGHPNTIKTCYIILKRTDANYESAKNKSGTRYFAVQHGDLRLSVARKMTVADIEEYRYDPDWHPAIRAMIGRNVTSTPAKGDDARRDAWNELLAEREKPKKKGKKKSKKKRK